MWKFPIPWRSNGTPTMILFCHIWVMLLNCGVMENVFITGVVKRGNSQYIPNVSNKGGYTLSNRVSQWDTYQPTPPMQHYIIFFFFEWTPCEHFHSQQHCPLPAKPPLKNQYVSFWSCWECWEPGNAILLC